MSERVDVTNKVDWVEATRSGWVVTLPTGRKVFVSSRDGYYDDIDKTLHIDAHIAQEWGLI